MPDPTPWAQAVEAMRGTVGSPGRFPDADCERVLSAALPHLLRAVVGELEWERINALRAALAEIQTEGRTNPEAYYVEYRTALHAALTAAAGRVGT